MSQRKRIGLFAVAASVLIGCQAYPTAPVSGPTAQKDAGKRSVQAVTCDGKGTEFPDSSTAVDGKWNGFAPEVNYWFTTPDNSMRIDQTWSIGLSTVRVEGIDEGPLGVRS